MSDPRTAKLPKWAQQHITNLEREVQGLKDELDAIDGLDDAPLTIRYRGYLSEPRGVSQHAILEWYGGGGGRRDGITVSIREDGQVLSIQGGGALNIMPRSTNLIYVRSEEW